MNTFLSLLLAGAAALTPHADEQPSQRITIGARVFYPGGKAAGAMQQRATLGAAPSTWYVFTGKTLCEAQTVSSERPSFAGSGWKIDVKPAPNGLQVTWERLWAGGKPASGGGSKILSIASGSPAVLDSIDGGTRLQRQAYIDRLKSVSPTDLSALSSIDALEDGLTSKLKNQLSEQEKTRRELIEVEKLGATNTRVVAIDSGITSTRKQLLDALSQNLASVLRMLQTNSPTAPVDGCDALSMTLEVSAEAAAARVALETEFWLVHRDPSGKEDTQRQVVRSIGYGVDFVFDDIPIQTPRGLVTLETYGEVSLTPAGSPNDSVWMNLTITRRGVTTNPSFGWKTKEGGTSFSQAIRPEEVVSFQLAPIKDDDGALLGHRFSLRVRTKVLK